MADDERCTEKEKEDRTNSLYIIDPETKEPQEYGEESARNGRFIYVFRSSGDKECLQPEAIMMIMKIKHEVGRRALLRGGEVPEWRATGALFNIKSGDFIRVASRCWIELDRIPSIALSRLLWMQKQANSLPDNATDSIQCRRSDQLYKQGIEPEQALPVDFLLSRVQKEVSRLSVPILNAQLRSKALSGKEQRRERKEIHDSMNVELANATGFTGANLQLASGANATEKVRKAFPGLFAPDPASIWDEFADDSAVRTQAVFEEPIRALPGAKIYLKIGNVPREF